MKRSSGRTALTLIMANCVFGFGELRRFRRIISYRNTGTGPSFGTAASTRTGSFAVSIAAAGHVLSVSVVVNSIVEHRRNAAD